MTIDPLPLNNVSNRAKDLTVTILRNQATAGHLTRSQEKSWLGAHLTGKKPRGQGQII